MTEQLHWGVSHRNVSTMNELVKLFSSDLNNFNLMVLSFPLLLPHKCNKSIGPSKAIYIAFMGLILIINPK